jgi:hypothetical protein
MVTPQASAPCYNKIGLPLQAWRRRGRFMKHPFETLDNSALIEHIQRVSEL